MVNIISFEKFHDRFDSKQITEQNLNYIKDLLRGKGINFVFNIQPNAWSYNGDIDVQDKDVNNLRELSYYMNGALAGLKIHMDIQFKNSSRVTLNFYPWF